MGGLLCLRCSQARRELFMVARKAGSKEHLHVIWACATASSRPAMQAVRTLMPEDLGSWTGTRRGIKSIPRLNTDTARYAYESTSRLCTPLLNSRYCF